MTYRSDHSPDAARHNQLDRTQSGILDFDARNTINEGQAAIALGSGSTAIEVDLEGANVLIDGSKVSAPPNTVTLSDGHDTLWRLDHIYVSESGGYSVQEGEPQPNEYVTHSISNGSVTQDIQSNEVAGGPRPKGTDFASTQGELVYSVLVPSGATTAQDLSTQHIQDRRRLAPDVLDLGMPRQPTITSRHFNIEGGDWEMWPVVAWPDQTLRLWEYTITQANFGMFTNDNIHIYLIDYTPIDSLPQDEFADAGGDGIDWSEYAVWESSQLRQTSRGDPSDIILERDVTAGVDSHAFVIANEGNTHGSRFSRLGFQATYSIENTSDL